MGVAGEGALEDVESDGARVGQEQSGLVLSSARIPDLVGKTSCSSQLKMLCGLGYSARETQRSVGAQPCVRSRSRARRAAAIREETARPLGVGKLVALVLECSRREKRLLSM